MLHKSNSADPISTKPCGGRHPSCLMQAGPSLSTKPPTPNLSTNESALDTLAEVTWLCLLLQLSRATTALLKDLRSSVRCELGLVVREELTKKEWRKCDSFVLSFELSMKGSFCCRLVALKNIITWSKEFRATESNMYKSAQYLYSSLSVPRLWENARYGRLTWLIV